MLAGAPDADGIVAGCVRGRGLGLKGHIQNETAKVGARFGMRPCWDRLRGGLKRGWRGWELGGAGIEADGKGGFGFGVVCTAGGESLVVGGGAVGEGVGFGNGIYGVILLIVSRLQVIFRGTKLGGIGEFFGEELVLEPVEPDEGVVGQCRRFFAAGGDDFEHAVAALGEVLGVDEYLSLTVPGEVCLYAGGAEDVGGVLFGGAGGVACGACGLRGCESA